MARDVESVSPGQGTFAPVKGVRAPHSQRRDRTPGLPKAGPSPVHAVSTGKVSGLISRRDAASTRVCSRDTSSDGGTFATGAITNHESAAAQRICRHYRLQRCEQRPPGRFRTASKSAERRRWGAYRARKGAKGREMSKSTGNQRRAEKLAPQGVQPEFLDSTGSRHVPEADC